MNFIYRHIKVNSIQTSLIFIVWIAYFLSGPVSASVSFSDQTQEDLYNKGLAYRNKEQFVEAIDCFTPLAEKNFVKAQHNLAVCFYKLNQVEQAYQWFKRASDLGFTPSNNNLEKIKKLHKINLLNLLLPDETLSHIASFLPLKGFSHFKLVSKRSYQIFKSIIIETDFLNSEKPYAVDFRDLLFKEINFDPEPKEIRLKLSVDADEVHFRDTEHLRSIVKEIPRIQSKKLLFVFDDKVIEGNELISIKNKLKKEYFIHVIADVPINISGTILLSCPLVLPTRSDLENLNSKGSSISCGNLTAYKEAHDLADVLDSFNEQLFKIRTEDAFLLLEERKNSRIQSPTSYPDLFTLCPDFYLLSTSKVKISQHDYIVANKPLIYIADSISTLKKLKSQLPMSSASICYINSRFQEPGLYCSGPLSLRKGFTIFTEKGLTALGRLHLNDHNLSIKSNGFWMFGTKISASGDISLCGKFHIGIHPLYPIFESNIKPEKMPIEDWHNFVNFALEQGIFS